MIDFEMTTSTDKDLDKAPKAKAEKGAKKPSAKTQKIAAATKAKRAAKKKIAE